MHYTIEGFMPRPGMGMSGFNVILHPQFKDLVKSYHVTTGETDNLLRTWTQKTMGVEILEAWGLRYSEMTFPRVAWGEWGPEHIDVPGNACGLDITHSHLGCSGGCAALVPHNVDSQAQAGALLSIFTWFAQAMWIEWEVSTGKQTND